MELARHRGETSATKVAYRAARHAETLLNAGYDMLDDGTPELENPGGSTERDSAPHPHPAPVHTCSTEGAGAVATGTQAGRKRGADAPDVIGLDHCKGYARARSP